MTSFVMWSDRRDLCLNTVLNSTEFDVPSVTKGTSNLAEFPASDLFIPLEEAISKVRCMESAKVYS